MTWGAVDVPAVVTVSLKWILKPFHVSKNSTPNFVLQADAFWIHKPWDHRA